MACTLLIPRQFRPFNSLSLPPVASKRIPWLKKTKRSSPHANESGHPPQVTLTTRLRTLPTPPINPASYLPPFHQSCTPQPPLLKTLHWANMKKRHRSTTKICSITMTPLSPLTTINFGAHYHHPPRTALQMLSTTTTRPPPCPNYSPPA